MPLPATIGAGLSWSDHKNVRLGPFENGSNLYAVLLDKTNNHVEVWKSTDGGETWAEQDSANHKAAYALAAGRCADAHQVGATLTITFNSPTSPAINRVTFDLSTDTWGTATASTEVQRNSVSATAPGFVVQRSGDVVFFGQGALESIMGTGYRRVRYLRSGAWNTSVDVGGTGAQIHYDARTAILGSSDRVHFFWTDHTNGDLKHRTLTGANALQAIQDVDTAMLSQAAYAVGLPALNGSEVVLPFLNELTNSVLAVARATSADAPTWSVQDVSATANVPEQLNANPGAAAVDGSTVHVFWPNDADQDIYRDNDAGTGTWGTDTEWKDAVTCDGISIAKITNAIGVLYDDGGTVKYDAYALTIAQDTPELRGRPFGRLGDVQMRQLIAV